MSLIYPWIDSVWLIAGMILAHKGQRLVMAAFFIACFIMMRMQIELLSSIGFETGILPLWDATLFLRGLIVYSVFYVLYLGLCFWSKDGNAHIHLAASISLFFAAFFTSTVIMIV